jgi:PAS domain S-box-containing protein
MNTPKVFEQLYKVSPIGIAFLSANGDFIEANTSFCDIISYSEPELIKRNIEDITHPEDYDTFVELTNRIKSGEINYYNCYGRYISKLGKAVWTKITAYGIKEENGLKFIVLHIQQIVNGEKFKLEYKNSQELHLKEKATLLPFLIDNWQWVISALIFIMGTIIALGIVIYSSAGRIDVLEKILLDRVKIETKDENLSNKSN